MCLSYGLICWFKGVMCGICLYGYVYGFMCFICGSQTCCLYALYGLYGVILKYGVLMCLNGIVWFYVCWYGKCYFPRCLHICYMCIDCLYILCALYLSVLCSCLFCVCVCDPVAYMVWSVACVVRMIHRLLYGLMCVWWCCMVSCVLWVYGFHMCLCMWCMS